MHPSTTPKELNALGAKVCDAILKGVSTEIQHMKEDLLEAVSFVTIDCLPFSTNMQWQNLKLALWFQM